MKAHQASKLKEWTWIRRQLHSTNLEQVHKEGIDENGNEV